MAWEWGIALELLVLLIAALWSAVRVRREQGRQRSTVTAACIWAVYLLHLASVIALAVRPVFPMALPWGIRGALGGVLLISGVTLTALGMLQFGTVKRMSGRDTSRLITGGVYEWTRNPQNVGWIIAQVGIAILGASLLGLAMSIVFGLVFLVYVRAEERHLEKVFGEEYRLYQQQSHRLFGLPTSWTRIGRTKSDLARRRGHALQRTGRPAGFG